MLKAIFLSDLHLGSLEEPKSQLLLKFLKKLKGGKDVSHLFLVGDVFDLWLGSHKYFIGKYSELVEEFIRLKSDGVEIHYFEGNHDLYLKHYWQDQLGFAVHSKPEIFKLGSFRVRVEHGDQMDPEDRGYIFLRWFLRTPLMKIFVRIIPGSLAAWIGQRASHSSRSYTSETKTISDEGAKDKIRTYSELVAQEQEFTLHIHGHVHVRDDYRYKANNRDIRSVNLGSWFDQPGYFSLTEDKQEFIDLK